MSEIKTNELLSQLQLIARQVQEGNPSISINQSKDDSLNFSEVIKESINGVNDQQMKAGATAKAFEMNDPDVPLSNVMIEMQKARVSFEALKQVRNQLVDAYKQVMNMPL